MSYKRLNDQPQPNKPNQIQLNDLSNTKGNESSHVSFQNNLYPSLQSGSPKQKPNNQGSYKYQQPFKQGYFRNKSEYQRKDNNLHNQQNQRNFISDQQRQQVLQQALRNKQKEKEQQKQKQEGNQKSDNTVKWVLGGILFLFIGFIFYLLSSGGNNENSGLQGNEQNVCQNKLPYSLDELRYHNFEYYQWYAKSTPNVQQKAYQTGHFIQKNIANTQQYPYWNQYNNQHNPSNQFSNSHNNNVFYSWDEAIRAFNMMNPQICQTNKKQIQYEFQYTITDRNKYIKGMSANSNTVESFSKLHVVYRRAVRNQSPTNADYFKSNFVTLWMFYPKK